MRFSLFTSGLLLLTNSGFWASARHTRGLVFDPLEFRQQVVTCPAVNRALNKAVDLHLRYVDVNPSFEHTLLFLHGWPSLWASWKYQIQEFRVIQCRLELCIALFTLLTTRACRATIGLLFPISVGLAHRRTQGMFSRLAQFPTWSEI